MSFFHDLFTPTRVEPVEGPVRPGPVGQAVGLGVIAAIAGKNNNLAQKAAFVAGPFVVRAVARKGYEKGVEDDRG